MEIKTKHGKVKINEARIVEEIKDTLEFEIKFAIEDIVESLVEEEGWSVVFEADRQRVRITNYFGDDERLSEVIISAFDEDEDQIKIDDELYENWLISVEELRRVAGIIEDKLKIARG